MTRQERYIKYKKRCRKLGLYESDFEELALIIPEELSTRAERISLKNKAYFESTYNLYEIFDIHGKFVCLINIETGKTLLVKPQIAIRGIFSYYVLCNDDTLLPKKEVQKKIKNLETRIQLLRY